MLKVENLNTLLSSLEDNQYVLCSIEVTDSKGKLSVNAPIPSDISSKICNEINKFSTDRVILICRSRSEQYTNPFPYPETLKEIMKAINKKVTIFYQNPYPYNVPKFNKNLFTIGCRALACQSPSCGSPFAKACCPRWGASCGCGSAGQTIKNHI